MASQDSEPAPVPTLPSSRRNPPSELQHPQKPKQDRFKYLLFMAGLVRNAQPRLRTRIPRSVSNGSSVTPLVHGPLDLPVSLPDATQATGSSRPSSRPTSTPHLTGSSLVTGATQQQQGALQPLNMPSTSLVAAAWAPTAIVDRRPSSGPHVNRTQLHNDSRGAQRVTVLHPAFRSHSCHGFADTDDRHQATAKQPMAAEAMAAGSHLPSEVQTSTSLTELMPRSPHQDDATAAGTLSPLHPLLTHEQATQPQALPLLAHYRSSAPSSSAQSRPPRAGYRSAPSSGTHMRPEGATPAAPSPYPSEVTMPHSVSDLDVMGSTPGAPASIRHHGRSTTAGVLSRDDIFQCLQLSSPEGTPRSFTLPLTHALPGHATSVSTSSPRPIGHKQKWDAHYNALSSWDLYGENEARGEGAVKDEGALSREHMRARVRLLRVNPLPAQHGIAVGSPRAASFKPGSPGIGPPHTGLQYEASQLRSTLPGLPGQVTAAVWGGALESGDRRLSAPDVFQASSGSGGPMMQQDFVPTAELGSDGHAAGGVGGRLGGSHGSSARTSGSGTTLATLSANGLSYSAAGPVGSNSRALGGAAVAAHAKMSAATATPRLGLAIARSSSSSLTGDSSAVAGSGPAVKGGGVGGNGAQGGGIPVGRSASGGLLGAGGSGQRVAVGPLLRSVSDLQAGDARLARAYQHMPSDWASRRSVSGVLATCEEDSEGEARGVTANTASGATSPPARHRSIFPAMMRTALWNIGRGAARRSHPTSTTSAISARQPGGDGSSNAAGSVQPARPVAAPSSVSGLPLHLSRHARAGPLGEE